MREQLIVVKEQTRRENIAFLTSPICGRSFTFGSVGGGGVLRECTLYLEGEFQKLQHIITESPNIL